MKRLAIRLVTAGLLLACSSAAYSGSVTLDDDYKNYPPYGMSFYGQILSGRAWVFEHTGDNRDFHNVPQGVIFHADGAVSRCMARSGGDWGAEEGQRWSVVGGDHGAMVKYEERGEKPGYVRFFYDPVTGAMDIETLRQKKKTNTWTRSASGWVQDSWPRVLADACPKLKLAAGMEVNAGQTSRRLNEMRAQVADAPIRDFPGSHLTAPGRTGLAASGGEPTTTKAAVWAFMNEQEGNILLGPKGHGRVFVRGADGAQEHEIWGLRTDDGSIDWVAGLVETAGSDGEWLEWTFKGKAVARYPMGYPLPYVPTGYRHAAFQLTDTLIESGEPVALPWMPAEWKDFTFRADGTVRARRANDGPDRIAPWRWTKGRLWVQIGGNREAPGWEEVAEHLGMEKPKLWTPADGQRIEVASAEPATSGTGKCVGDHEGVATWTLGADGKRVWDTSGCRPKTE